MALVQCIQHFFTYRARVVSRAIPEPDELTVSFGKNSNGVDVQSCCASTTFRVRLS
jgi:hypothetical protein